MATKRKAVKRRAPARRAPARRAPARRGHARRKSQKSALPGITDKIISVITMRIGVNMISSMVADKMPALKNYSEIIMPQLVKMLADRVGMGSPSLGDVADTMTAIGAADMISGKMGFAGLGAMGALGDVNDIGQSYPIRLNGIAEMGALTENVDVLDSSYPLV